MWAVPQNSWGPFQFLSELYLMISLSLAISECINS
uniref:Uncharacterized protein n=1 Tax=Anguilla anguilla TaxID=7936 RepID=A0A0E9RYY0_ANGAN